MKKTQKMGIFDLYNALKRTWHAKKQKASHSAEIDLEYLPSLKTKSLVRTSNLAGRCAIYWLNAGRASVKVQLNGEVPVRMSATSNKFVSSVMVKPVT
jgi:hypothetical protein